MGCTLHNHSLRSDGDLSVEQLIELASKEQIMAIAVTDHNQILEVETKKMLEEKYPEMEIICGIEISCNYQISNRDNPIEVHIVGLFPEPSEDLSKLGKRIFETNVVENENERKIYINSIIKKLESEHIFIPPYECLKKIYPNKQISRIHIAEQMVNQCCSTIKECLDVYIGDYGQKKCWVRNTETYINMNDAVKMILNNKGIPVCCHIFSYNLSMEELHILLKDFSDNANGIGSMEVYYSKFTPEQIEIAEHLCSMYNLIPSAADDFHRKDEDTLKKWPFEIYENMIKKYKEYYDTN